MSDPRSAIRSLRALARALLPALAVVGLAAPGAAHAQSAAQRAVDAAKKICAGKTITIVWEAGLQSLDPLNFSGPKWEQLTGCKVKVVEVPVAEMFGEASASSGAVDEVAALLAEPGALELLKAYVGLPRGVSRSALVEFVRSLRQQPGA